MSADAEAAGRLPRMVGLNHIALEVGDVEAALVFYGQIFEIRLRGRADDAAFIDLGDQFIALMQGPVRAAPGHRHFGLVVDDCSIVRSLVEKAGATLLDGPFLDFLDPWGNRIEVVRCWSIAFRFSWQILGFVCPGTIHQWFGAARIHGVRGAHAGCKRLLQLGQVDAQRHDWPVEASQSVDQLKQLPIENGCCIQALAPHSAARLISGMQRRPR